MERYNITYGCGCVHEIEESIPFHKPTGNNQNCSEHK